MGRLSAGKQRGAVARGPTSSEADAAQRRGATTDATTTARGERIARAYRELRELIVWGRLAPGSRIVESEIVDYLGVSRTPVRSALHRLQQEGYVVGIGRGTEQRLTVAPLTQDDARDLFGIVGELEGLAIRGAASQAAAARAELVAALGQLNLSLSEAGDATHPEPMRICELDSQFHRRFVLAGAGQRLLALHHAIKPQAERYVRLYLSALVDEIARSVAEHREIIKRIRTGNADGAQRAVQRNWRNAAERLSTVIGRLGERGRW